MKNQFDCRVCDKKNLPLIKTLSFGKENNTDFIPLYHCPQCNSYFTNPPPYNYETDWEGVEYYLKLELYIKNRYKSIFSYVQKIRSMETFLDIGCGLGYSLVIGKEMGWTTYGIEPNTKLAEYSQKVFKLNIINDYFDIDYFPKNFQCDFILLDNVLEHLGNPCVIFDQAVNLLTPGGIFLIVVPAVDWLRLMLSKIDFLQKNNISSTFKIYYDPVQHLNYFSQKSLITLLSRHHDLQLLPTFHHHLWAINFHKILGLSTGYYLIQKIR